MTLQDQLMRAIEDGEQERALALLEQGAYAARAFLEERGMAEWSEAIGEAVGRGQDEVAKTLFLALLDAAADPRFEMIDGPRLGGILIDAIDNGCMQAAMAMAPRVDFSLRQNIDAPNPLGAKALFSAARMRSAELVNMLISHDAQSHLGCLAPMAIVSAAVGSKRAGAAGIDLLPQVLDALFLIAPEARARELGSGLLIEAIDADCGIEAAKKIISATSLAGLLWWETPAPLNNPLCRALENGRGDVAEAILAACDEDSARMLCSRMTYDWNIPLLVAAEQCAAIPTELIRLSPRAHGLGFPTADCDGNTPLHLATRRPTPCNALALMKEFNPLAIDRKGNTPLMLLAGKSDMSPEWLDVALDWAASQPARKNSNGESALEIAIAKGNSKLALALIHTAQAEEMRFLWPLMLRVPLGKDGCLPAMALSARGSPEGIDADILLTAIYESREDFALSLIAKIADPAILDDASNAGMRAPLMAAASCGSARVLEALLPWANPHRRDKRGRTALMLAAGGGRSECASRLVAASDLSATDYSGCTALMHAVASENHELVEMLAALCSDETIAHMAEADGCTALSMAAEMGNAACVEALLRRGAPAHSGRYHPGPHALINAIASNSVAATRALLAASDPKATTVAMISPLLAATLSPKLGSKESREILDMLIPLSDLSQRDIFGDGPLDNLRESQNLKAAEMADFYNERALAIEEARAMQSLLRSTSGDEKRDPRRL